MRKEARDEEYMALNARNQSMQSLSIDVSRGQNLETLAGVHYNTSLANRALSSFIIYVVEL